MHSGGLGSVLGGLDAVSMLCNVYIIMAGIFFNLGTAPISYSRTYII